MFGTKFTGGLVVKLVLAISAIGFSFYSLNKVTPMSVDEINNFMQKITHLQQNVGGGHDLVQLRNFFSADDGEAFYTVNLYQYHPVVSADKYQSVELTGREVYDKFSQVMIKLLLTNHSYPIFGSNWLSLSKNEWDRIVIVRYRSRRDMAQVFADPAFAEASNDKWASLKNHERFVVKALHLPELYMLFCLLLLISIAVIYCRIQGQRN